MTAISKTSQNNQMNLIVYIIRSKARLISTNEMSETLGRSWEYTKNLLHLMWKKRMIRKIEKGKYDYWGL